MSKIQITHPGTATPLQEVEVTMQPNAPEYVLFTVNVDEVEVFSITSHGNLCVLGKLESDRLKSRELRLEGAGSYMRSQPMAVASLPPTSPEPMAGARAMVNDSTQDLANGIGSVVAGGGSHSVPVHCVNAGNDVYEWRIG
jgi:hypothetical protein